MGTGDGVVHKYINNSLKAQGSPVKFAALQFCELFNRAGTVQGIR